MEKTIAYLNNPPAEQPPPTLSKRAGRWLIWFFALMLLFTILSQAADHALVPRVQTDTPSGGVLDLTVSAQGIWSAGEIKPILVQYPGLRVDEVFVKPGQSVAAGDPLYSYTLESIEDAMAELRLTVQKYELQVKELQAGENTTVETALFALNSAEQGYQQAQEKLYMAEENLSRSKWQAYEDAEYSLNALENKRDAEVKAARRELAALEDGLDPNDPATAQTLADARRALSALEDSWDAQLAEPRRGLEKARQEWESLNWGGYDTEQELSTYYDGITAAARDVESASLAYEQAKKSEKAARSLTGYQVEGVRLSMKKEQTKLDYLSTLREASGVVLGEIGGLVVEHTLVPGKTLSGEESVSLSTKALALRLTLTKDEAEHVAVGDSVSLYLDGRKLSEKLAVDSVEPAADEHVIVLCAGEPPENASVGKAQSCAIEKTSGKQNLRVPLSALMQDGSGQTYVLTVGERQGILGTEYVAERMNVTLLQKDNRYAGVDGQLSPSAVLIVSSTKPVEEGDRVVVADG